MTVSAQPTPARYWQQARQLPGRVPLRVKLISALLALVVAALIAISVAGISFLRGYLLGGTDSGLQAFLQSPRLQGYVETCLAPGSNCSMPAGAIDWVPADGTLHRIVTPMSGGFPGGEKKPMPGPAVGSVLPWLTTHPGQPLTVPATSGDGRWRVMAMSETVLPPLGGQSLQNGTVIVAQDVSSVYKTLGRLVSIDLIVSGVIVAALTIVGVAIVRSSLRPLIDIEHTAEAIAAGDLSRRVPDLDPRSEVGRLGRSLNTMLSQIESAFHARTASEAAARRSEERMRRFVADASHELRTPLTTIRGYAEFYRQRGGSVESTAVGSADMDRIMQRVEQESTRMGLLVEDMLLLARMDQQRPLELRPVDLLTLAVDAVQDARTIAPARTIELKVSPGPAFLVLGDEPRLRQVLGNLMGNALTHTPEGTPVEVRIGVAAQPPAPSQDQCGPCVVVQVADRGPGLSAEQAEHVFERFYRADQARDRKTGGTGLGLAIVAALVAAHGGVVGVDTNPGQGATFWIALPLAADAQGQAGDEPDEA